MNKCKGLAGALFGHKYDKHVHCSRCGKGAPMTLIEIGANGVLKNVRVSGNFAVVVSQGCVLANSVFDGDVP